MCTGCELVDSTAIQPVIPRSDPAYHLFVNHAMTDVLSYPLPNLMVFSSHPPLPPEFSVISVLLASLFATQPQCSQ